MGGACPICHNHVEGSFGMIQCHHCQSVLFIDFAGKIIVGDIDLGSQDGQFLSEEADHRNLDEPSPFLDPNLEPIDVPVIETPLEIENENQFEPLDFNQNENQIEDQTQPAGPIGDSKSNKAQEMDYSMDLLSSPATNFTSSREDNLSPPNVSHHQVQSESFEHSHLRIILDGVDTAQLRSTVLEQLRDSRLGLVMENVQSSLTDGRLVLNGLNIVKASSIINSLKGLPLELKWETYGEQEESTLK